MLYGQLAVGGGFGLARHGGDYFLDEYCSPRTPDDLENKCEVESVGVSKQLSPKTASVRLALYKSMALPIKVENARTNSSCAATVASPEDFVQVRCFLPAVFPALAEREFLAVERVPRLVFIVSLSLLLTAGLQSGSLALGRATLQGRSSFEFGASHATKDFR